MKKNLVNNYEAINEAGVFRKKYIVPLQERSANARKVFGDADHKWKDDKEKKAAQKKFDDIQERVNDYNVLYDKVLKLAREHEGLVDLLTQQYMRWHGQVSFSGQQQKEMMQGQADILQDIFTQIYEALDNLCLYLPKPTKNEESS